MRNVFYLIDRAKMTQLNAAGQDYTPAYIRALLKYMGISGTACAPEALGMLGKNDVLLIGAESIDAVPDGPGAVVLLGTRIGAPVKPASKRPGICGWYPVKTPADKKTLLPLFAPVEDPQAGTTEVLTEGYVGEVRPEGDAREPLLVKRGDNVWHFLFDLPASVWYSGDGDPQGAPVFEFPVGRTPDTRPVPADYDTTVAYNDLLVRELELILDKLEVPSLYRLPPAKDGKVPDFALHISGDDDHTSAELDLKAAEVARELGLPYHINLMSEGGKFIVDRAQVTKLRELGTETALHSNFLEHPYSAESQKLMADIYVEELGRAPVTNVNHCLIQGGPSAERLRWLAQCGIVADNGKFCERDLSDINALTLRASASARRSRAIPATTRRTATKWWLRLRFPSHITNRAAPARREAGRRSRSTSTTPPKTAAPRSSSSIRTTSTRTILSPRFPPRRSGWRKNTGRIRAIRRCSPPPTNSRCSGSPAPAPCSAAKRPGWCWRPRVRCWSIFPPPAGPYCWTAKRSG